MNSTQMNSRPLNSRPSNSRPLNNKVMNKRSMQRSVGATATNPPPRRRARPALWRCAAIVLLALLAAGCVTTQVVRHPAQPEYQPAPAVAEAAALAGNDAALAGQARADNAARIAQLLAGLDDATLVREAAAMPAGNPLYAFAGRALLERGLPLPHAFDRSAWHFDDTRPPAAPDGYRPPRKLAVLLPLSGSLARAAGPVRDGLLSGYYAESRPRPEIRFYDTATGATAAYASAVAEGADLVLGPLGRDEVDALFHSQPTVPVLALNRGDLRPPPGNASFALAPEDDGIAAAGFLLARGARRVLVLDGGGMQRASAAFAARFQGRGGTIVATVPVAAKAGDLGGALAAAVQAPGGIDGVFLALKPEQADALAPQLAQAGLGAKPRVATSQFANAGKVAAGHALDGIAFPIDAWSVRSVAGLPSSSEAGATLANARGPAARLFAFGFDAWQLAAHLEHLVTDPAAFVDGATGALRLDGFGEVVRTPAWASYSGAVAVPLPAGG